MTRHKDIPNLFLIGAPKSATTFLYDVLSRTPGVFTAENKEPAYFHFDGQIPQHRDAPLKPLYACLTLDDYKALYSAAGDARYVVDASTHYLSTPESAARIRAAQPTARVIAVLREPVTRAYSHYLMGVRDGFISEDLMSALDREEYEIEQSDVLWGEHYRMIRRSEYFAGLKAFHAAFGDRFRLYLFEDLKKDPDAVFDDLRQFLDLEIIEPGEKSLQSARNAYAVDRVWMITRLLNVYRASRLRLLVNKITPVTLRKILRETYEKIRLKDAGKPEMPEVIRERLTMHLEEDYAQTLQYAEKHGLLARLG
ncbi:sulfotransferase family protein [Ruegeria arenilitoris]|uniref:sulfotransferase family protein n=1 Tax=Ruegeria arenilitoris TaxID=1173585 RepID=UPI00148073E2|nr:sulfotransferase [Ruegeria arenilitoris]